MYFSRVNEKFAFHILGTGSLWSPDGVRLKTFLGALQLIVTRHEDKMDVKSYLSRNQFFKNARGNCVFFSDYQVGKVTFDGLELN